MPKIGGHAQPLGPRGQYGSNCFPAQQDEPRDDRILKEQAQSKKHRAISDTRQGGHQQIIAELMKARPVKNVGPAGGTKSVVGKVKASENGAFEEKNGDQRARQKLPDDQDFPSHRNKKLVVKGALDHLAAKQPGENTHAREKDAQPHVVKMNNAREHARLGLDVERIGGMVGKCQLDQENHNRDLPTIPPIRSTSRPKRACSRALFIFTTCGWASFSRAWVFSPGCFAARWSSAPFTTSFLFR